LVNLGLTGTLVLLVIKGEGVCQDYQDLKETEVILVLLEMMVPWDCLEPQE